MKKALSLLILSLGLSLNANAFIFEPFVSYESGENEDNEDVTGTAFGLRLGGSTLGFIYGLEYQTGSVTVDSTPEVDLDFTDMGLFAGYEFPILIRAYATYYISHKADQGANELEGSGGMKLGVGYTGLPFIAINFEKMTRTYDERDGVALSTDSETDSYMISVSLPLP